MMDVYLLFLKSTISEIAMPHILLPKLNTIIKKTLKINESINIIPQACSQLPDSNDIRLVIVKQMNVSLEQQRYLADQVNMALRDDQGNYKITYNTIIKFDSNFVLPNSKKYGAEQSEINELDYKQRAENFSAVKPEYTFERVILPEKVRNSIDDALNIFIYQKKVFDEWGLREIEPHPSVSLSFYGPSGTGKTMAAEAIANKLGKKILRVSYADIESKYHGEGPKMVKAIFYAAQRDDAVLFIDESDSLLSKRLTNVSSGSDQAINSMRSQLLISLERFEGIVVFATNLVVNYDQAFLTRLISVEFVLPDKESRKKIWEVHLKPTGKSKLNIPLSDDINIEELALRYEFCGREIKKAVITACIHAAVSQQPFVSQSDLIYAAEKILDEELNLSKAKDHTASRASNIISSDTERIMGDYIKQHVNNTDSKIPD